MVAFLKIELIDKGGLGLKEVLDYIGVPYKCQALQLQLHYGS